MRMDFGAVIILNSIWKKEIHQDTMKVTSDGVIGIVMGRIRNPIVDLTYVLIICKYPTEKIQLLKPVSSHGVFWELECDFHLSCG